MSDRRQRTVSDSVGELDAARRGRVGRRVIVLALGAFLILALTGVLGGAQITVSAQRGAHGLAVTFPSTTRGGLHVDVVMTVERTDGFADPVALAVPHAYLELFDEGTLQPQPARETSTGGYVVWEFDPPPGERLRVRLDARVRPDAHRGRSGYVAVVEDGSTVVRVELATKVMP